MVSYIGTFMQSVPVADPTLEKHLLSYTLEPTRVRHFVYAQKAKHVTSHNPLAQREAPRRPFLLFVHSPSDERRRVIHLIVSSDLDHRKDLRPGHRVCIVQRSQVVVDMNNTLQWRLSLWN